MARALMAGRGGYALWRAAWAKPETFRLTEAEFMAALESGADPWYVPSGKGASLPLVGALCQGHHHVLGRMLSIWVAHVGNPSNPPPGHPAVAQCLPLNASLSAVEQLGRAGVDFSDPSAAAALFAKALAEPGALADSGFWGVADHLLGLAGCTIASLAPQLGMDAPQLFKSICKSYPSEDGNRIMVERGGWDLNWFGDTPYSSRVCDWLCQAISMKEIDPALLREAGLDWHARSKNGNTFAHCLVIDTRYAPDGNPVLPVDALVEALRQGLTLREVNGQDWSVVQRINSIRWSNDDEKQAVLSGVQAAALDQKTAAPSGRARPSRL